MINFRDKNMTNYIKVFKSCLLIRTITFTIIEKIILLRQISENMF